jgi:hypothetical protein
MTKSHTKIKKLERDVQELALDLKAITEEHDHYCFGTNLKETEAWFHSLPIETLKESLDRQYGHPRSKPSLQDMKHKFNLRKLHDETQAELLEKQSKLFIAKIDRILELCKQK